MEVPTEMVIIAVVIIGLPLALITIGLLFGIFYDYFKTGRRLAKWITNKFRKAQQEVMK